MFWNTTMLVATLAFLDPFVVLVNAMVEAALLTPVSRAEGPGKIVTIIV